MACRAAGESPPPAASTTLQWVVVNCAFWPGPDGGVSVVGIMRGELAAQEWSRPGCQVRISKSVACFGPWAPLGHFSHPVSRRNLRVVAGQMRRAASVCASGITHHLGQAYFDGHVHDPVNSHRPPPSVLCAALPSLPCRGDSLGLCE
jgi:hypothetical protein